MWLCLLFHDLWQKKFENWIQKLFLMLFLIFNFYQLHLVRNQNQKVCFLLLNYYFAQFILAFRVKRDLNWVVRYLLAKNFVIRLIQFTSFNLVLIFIPAPQNQLFNINTSSTYFNLKQVLRFSEENSLKAPLFISNQLAAHFNNW